jgi:hypothetical protein
MFSRAFLLLTALLGLAAFPAEPARGAQLKVIQPADRSLVRGPVQFRIAPGDEPRDQFLENPYLRIHNGAGQLVREFRVPRDAKTQICSAVLDSTALPDGQYQVEVTYRTLVGGKAVETQQHLTIGIRNSGRNPGRFSVSAPDKATKTDQAADIRVKVLDSGGRPLAGARVLFKASAGTLESEAEITDGDGEAFITLESEDPGAVTVTVTVENLPPQTRTVRFVE